MSRVPTLPKMPECTDCGDCCGPVTATFAEAAKIRKFTEQNSIEWIEHDDPLTCGFYNGRCRIYSVRPAACRMYGVVKEMPCPYFPQAARISLPAKDAIARGMMNVKDWLLSEFFAPDHGARQKGTPEVATVTKMQRLITRGGK